MSKHNKHLRYFLFTSLAFILLGLAGCGADYLTNSERSRVTLTLERAQQAKEQFSEPTLQTSQIVLRVIQDATRFMDAVVDKAPMEHQSGLVKLKQTWEQKVLQTTVLGREQHLAPFYRFAADSLDLTIELLEKIKSIDDEM
jgi:hypothetical protein